MFIQGLYTRVIYTGYMQGLYTRVICKGYIHGLYARVIYTGYMQGLYARVIYTVIYTVICNNVPVFKFGIVAQHTFVLPETRIFKGFAIHLTSLIAIYIAQFHIAISTIMASSQVFKCFAWSYFKCFC